jgi:hypothetical protein
MEINFVSYDGKYPNLCAGTLVISIDGEVLDLGRCLHPGDECGVDWSGPRDIVKTGGWEFEPPNCFMVLNPYRKLIVNEITRLLNEEWPVPMPCCGGCL